MKNWTALLVCVAMLLSVPIRAEDKASSVLTAMTQRIKADRKAFVAAKLPLTETEAKGFWPLYEAYQTDLAKINERLYKAVETYATAYKAKSLTDEQATMLLNEFFAIDESDLDLRKGYVPKLAAVLPPKKVVAYIQIEHNIRAQVRYELAKALPLVVR